MLWLVERIGTNQLTFKYFWNNFPQRQAHPSLWVWKVIWRTYLMPGAESELTVVTWISQNEGQFYTTLPKQRQTRLDKSLPDAHILHLWRYC